MANPTPNPTQAVRADAVILDLAAALDLDIADWLGGGDDGEVWGLADGRVLKVTASQEEAAACLMLQAARPDLPPGLPVVAEVRRIEGGISVGAFVRPVDTPVWVIVREEADVDAADLGDDWHDLLTDLNIAWMTQNHELLEALGRDAQALALSIPYGQVVTALTWLRDHLTLGYADIQASNLGRIRGQLGPFDFGRSVLLPEDLERALRCPVLQIAIGTEADPACCT